MSDPIAEIERLQKLTATCSCGTPGLDYEGPQADCPVHGAIRALNEAQAENGRLRDKLNEAVVKAEAHFTTYLETVAQRDAAMLIVEELQALRDTLYGQLDSAIKGRDQAEVEPARIAAEIEAERDKVREAEGATGRDENVINGIVNGLSRALQIVRGER